MPTFSHLPRLLLAEDFAPPPPLPSPPPFAKHPPLTPSFRPSIAVVIGVLTTMFSLTFLLLLYARHCKRHASGGSSSSYGGGGNGASSSAERRSSGVDRSVVESLPVFRFGSLTGQKEGLECAVCLGPFEPAEVLRLLPKCKHGFHVECVDIWLEAHSTCPLCRARVDPEDVLLVLNPKPEPEPLPVPAPAKDSTTSKSGDGGGGRLSLALPPFVRRISGRHSSAGERRCPASAVAAAAQRRSVGGDLTAAARKDGLLLTEAEREEFERRFNHRIIVGDRTAAMGERWSDLKPSDLLYLQSEMILADTGRISAAAAGGRNAGGLRSVSEITGVSRFRAGEEQQLAVTKKWLGFGPKRTGWWQPQQRT